MSSSDKRAVSALRDVSGQNDLCVQVAELYGWKYLKSESYPKHRPKQFTYTLIAPDEKIRPLPKYLVTHVDHDKERVNGVNRLPDYPNDLNACAEFEKDILGKDVRLYLEYARKLSAKHGALDAIFASAEQRCRAFVETMEARSVPDGNDSSGAGSVSKEK